MNRNYLIIGIIAVVVILGGGVFMVSKSSKSSSTTSKSTYKWQRMPDLGRTHVKEGTHVTYNSNPPTSGPHYPIWEKYGIKEKAPIDELLVHSLEHGYVIMSYNCAKLPKGASCDELKKQLTEITKEKRTWKLIVTPRQSLDVPLALTAWNYIDKMEKFDKTRVLAFIDDFRDHGPEQTME